MLLDLPGRTEDMSNQMIIDLAMLIWKTGNRLFTNINRLTINQNKYYFCNKDSANRTVIF